MSLRGVCNGAFIHTRTIKEDGGAHMHPSHRHHASSPEQLSHLQREAFNMKFITSPLAAHLSMPLFVQRNLGILQNR